MNTNRWSKVRLSAAVITAVLVAAAGSSAAATSPPTEPPGDSAGVASIPVAELDQALFDLLPERVQSEGVLLFGALWETPPVIGVDPADTTVPVGLAPDLAAAMAPILGVTIEWQNMQWPAQLPGVQAGTVDALFGQVSVTEERELSIVDLIPWNKIGESILVPAGNPEGLTRLGDACGLTMGVPVGSTQSELVTTVSADACEAAGEPAIELAEYQGATAAISALRAGTVDGWIDSTPSIEAVVAAEGDSFAAVAIPEDERPPTFGGIAVSKDQPGVTNAIAGALATLIENGTYDMLLEEWGMSAAAITLDELVVNPLTGTEVGVVAES
jgi:ABC-type amino acid transport substrate-binding protein